MDGDEPDAIEEAQDGGLPQTAKQEHFHFAFIRMVVAAAGFYIKSHDADFDGVDLTIASSAEYETWYCPEFELQLKCTTQHDLLGEDELSWTMKRKPFTKLVKGKRYNEAFIGVLVIPRDDEPLLHMDHDQLLTRSCMYWQHASELGDIADGAATKTVKLPRSNLFDVEALKGIMQRIGDGGEW